MNLIDFSRRSKKSLFTDATGPQNVKARFDIQPRPLPVVRPIIRLHGQSRFVAECSADLKYLNYLRLQQGSVTIGNAKIDVKCKRFNIIHVMIGKWDRSTSVSKIITRGCLNIDTRLNTLSNKQAYFLFFFSFLFFISSFLQISPKAHVGGDLMENNNNSIINNNRIKPSTYVQ